MILIPLLSAVISFSLFVSLAKQFIKKKKIHHFLYALSIFMFAIATTSEFFAEYRGFTPLLYKTYYFSAITLVAIMAAGTVYLVNRNKKWISHLFLFYVATLSIWLLIRIIPSQPIIDITGLDISIGGDAMPYSVRWFSFPLSAIGGMVLIFGALFSYWRTKYKGNLFIAGGAVVMASAGRLAAIGLTSFLSLSELIGIILLYYGVIIHPGSKK